MNKEDLQRGHLYRGKKQRKNLFTEETDDRVILYINDTIVQYDSYFISNGRYYPKTTIEKFLKWAKEEVK